MGFFSYNKNNNKFTDITFLKSLKYRKKLSKKMLKNEKRIRKCKTCNKELPKVFNYMDNLVDLRFKDATYNGHTKNQLMNNIEDTRKFYYKQAKMGINLKSKCFWHKRMLDNSYPLFEEWNDLNKYIQSEKK